MAVNGDNDNGENPIPELAALNINNYTLEELHNLRIAIDHRIEELAPPLDILRLCDYSSSCCNCCEKINWC